jgi:hypothetical protein
MPIFNIQGKPIKLAGVIPLYRDRDVSLVIDGINSSGVTLNLAQRIYVGTMIEGMKASGAWDKCNAIYGMVGGTAAAHKWNWKDMRDLDAAFRLISEGAGTITHNSNGATGGSNVIYNTFFNTSSFLAGNMHMSNFVTVDNATADTAMGFQSNNAATINMIARKNGLTNQSLKGLTNIISEIYAPILNTEGYHISTITGNTINYLFAGVKQISTSSATSLLSANGNIVLLGRRLPLIVSFKTYGLYTIGDGLTDTESRQMSNIITFAQKMRANF